MSRNTPPATTAAPRFRMDARFVIGLVLVLASVAGVVGVVLASNRTVTVFTAAVALAPGDELTSDRLALVEVHADRADALYLAPDRMPAEPSIVTRPVGPGEFVPLSALGAADESTVPVVVSLVGTPPTGIEPGAAVELWAAEPDERPGHYQSPNIVVQDAVVVRRIEHDRMLGTAEFELELRVPDHRVADVLAAITAGARLHVVPRYRTPDAVADASQQSADDPREQPGDHRVEDPAEHPAERPEDEAAGETGGEFADESAETEVP